MHVEKLLINVCLELSDVQKLLLNVHQEVLFVRRQLLHVQNLLANIRRLLLPLHLVQLLKAMLRPQGHGMAAHVQPAKQILHRKNAERGMTQRLVMQLEWKNAVKQRCFHSACSDVFCHALCNKLSQFDRNSIADHLLKISLCS